MDTNELTRTINMAKQGDRKAFGALYTAYYDTIYKFVLKKIGNKETAEDITQDIFMQSFEGIGSLNEPEKYRSWLYSIADHKCADHFRLQNKITVDSEDDLASSEYFEFAHGSVMLPDDYCVNADRADRLRGIIDTLKPDMKRALLLYYYDDLSISKVAEQLGTSENAVKQKLYRARRRLGCEIRKLEKNGAAFTLVPMREFLHTTVDEGAAVKPRSLMRSGTLIAAAKVAGMIAAVSLTISVPIGLYFTEHKLNERNDDSRVYIESSMADSSSPDSESSVTETEASRTATESSTAETQNSDSEADRSSTAPSSNTDTNSSRRDTPDSRADTFSSTAEAASSTAETESSVPESESSLTETESSKSEGVSSSAETESSKSETESSSTETESSEPEPESSIAEAESSIHESESSSAETESSETDTDSTTGAGKP